MAVEFFNDYYWNTIDFNSIKGDLSKIFDLTLLKSKNLHSRKYVLLSLYNKTLGLIIETLDY